MKIQKSLPRHYLVGWVGESDLLKVTKEELDAYLEKLHTRKDRDRELGLSRYVSNGDSEPPNGRSFMDATLKEVKMAVSQAMPALAPGPNGLLCRLC